MPTLKNLTCTVMWSGNNEPLSEYATTYTDGRVHCNLAIPESPTSFFIQLTSDGYIAQGLAMFICQPPSQEIQNKQSSWFLDMDGVYQCNRNRFDLQVPDDKTPKEKFEINFQVRQKEEFRPNGTLWGKKWHFQKLSQGTQSEGISAPFGGLHVGTIEVVVLRCIKDENLPITKTIFRLPSNFWKNPGQALAVQHNWMSALEGTSDKTLTTTYDGGPQIVSVSPETKQLQLTQPYWSTWKDEKTIEPSTSYRPQSLREGPSWQVPQEVVERSKTSHFVATDKPIPYMHKLSKPKYVDSFEKPYAVFCFKYRESSLIERELNIRILDSMNKVVESLQDISANELREQLAKVTFYGHKPGDPLPRLQTGLQRQNNACQTQTSQPPPATKSPQISHHTDYGNYQNPTEQRNRNEVNSNRQEWGNQPLDAKNSQSQDYAGATSSHRVDGSWNAEQKHSSTGDQFQSGGGWDQVVESRTFGYCHNIPHNESDQICETGGFGQAPPEGVSNDYNTWRREHVTANDNCSHHSRDGQTNDVGYGQSPGHQNSPSVRIADSQPQHPWTETLGDKRASSVTGRQREFSNSAERHSPSRTGDWQKQNFKSQQGASENVDWKEGFWANNTPNEWHPPGNDRSEGLESRVISYSQSASNVPAHRDSRQTFNKPGYPGNGISALNCKNSKGVHQVPSATEGHAESYCCRYHSCKHGGECNGFIAGQASKDNWDISEPHVDPDIPCGQGIVNEASSNCNSHNNNGGTGWEQTSGDRATDTWHEHCGDIGKANDAPNPNNDEGFQQNSENQDWDQIAGSTYMPGGW